MVFELGKICFVNTYWPKSIERNPTKYRRVYFCRQFEKIVTSRMTNCWQHLLILSNFTEPMRLKDFSVLSLHFFIEVNTTYTKSFYKTLWGLQSAGA